MRRIITPTQFHKPAELVSVGVKFAKKVALLRAQVKKRELKLSICRKLKSEKILKTMKKKSKLLRVVFSKKTNIKWACQNFLTLNFFLSKLRQKYSNRVQKARNELKTGKRAPASG